MEPRKEEEEEEEEEELIIHEFCPGIISQLQTSSSMFKEIAANCGDCLRKREHVEQFSTPGSFLLQTFKAYARETMTKNTGSRPSKPLQIHNYVLPDTLLSCKTPCQWLYRIKHIYFHTDLSSFPGRMLLKKKIQTPRINFNITKYTADVSQ
jgi:hypothetical protein